MPNQSEILNTRSEEMQEIVGRIPSWIIRWGLTLFFVVAILAVFVSSKIRFHDTLPATVIIQAKEQPGKVTISRQAAHQQFHFLVKEGDVVNAGDTLLVQYDQLDNTSIPTITPMSGTIYISKGIDESNTLDQIIWVVPQATSVEVKVNYGSNGAGNIKVGQPLRIALHDYPPSEYGYVEGYVESVLPIQVGDQQQANIRLTNEGIITDLGIVIAIRPVMKGDGEILLNERSILGRVFGSIIPL